MKFHKHEAMACQKINQATKALSATVRYLERYVLGGKTTFYVPKSEILVIDDVCKDFHIPETPMADRRFFEEREADYIDKLNPNDPLYSTLPTMEEIEPLYCLKSIDSLSIQGKIREKITELLMMRDRLYEIKESSLSCADRMGEVKHEAPCRTDRGKWRKSLIWSGIYFHMPVNTEDCLIYSKRYGQTGQMFRKQPLRYCGKEVLEDSVKILNRFLKENS